MGSAPDDVKGSDLLQYELDKVHGEQIKHNNEKWRAKAGKLRDAGAFCVPRPRETWERIDQPKFSGESFQLMDLKEVMSSLVTRPIQSRRPLQCLLEALILILASKPVQEGGGGLDRRRCYRTTLET